MATQPSEKAPYKGLEDGGRKTEAFIRELFSSMTEQHCYLIKKVDEAILESTIDALKAKIKTLDAELDTLHEILVLTAVNTTLIKHKNSRIDALRRRIDTAKEEVTLRRGAADAALQWLRRRCIGIALTELEKAQDGEPDGMTAVRKYLEVVKSKWGGKPADVRAEIEQSLFNLATAFTKADLSRLVAETDKLMLEMLHHTQDNPKAIANESIERAWSDTRESTHLTYHISNSAVELREILNFMRRNSDKDEPQSLAQVKEEITRFCRANAMSHDEVLRAQGAQTLTAARASEARVDRTAEQEQISTLERHLAQSLTANAAVGQEGMGMAGLGTPMVPQNQQTQHYGLGYQQHSEEICTFWDGQQCHFRGACRRTGSHTPGVNHREKFLKDIQDRKRHRQY